MAGTLLLSVHTARGRYFVEQTAVRELRSLTAATDLGESDARGQPWLVADLGVLLDAAPQSQPTRFHSLIVPLRRRSVALLVARVDDTVVPAAAAQPIPPLLAAHLAYDWVSGVLVAEEQPVLVIDAWRVAQHVARRARNSS